MKPLRVAVADDSSFIRLALARLLGQERTIEVVGLASSGEELLEHLAEWQPEAIVLDLAMPGMGGLGTLDALRTRPPVPVLILSTHSSQGGPQTIGRCIAAPWTSSTNNSIRWWISKPCARSGRSCIR